MAILGQALTGVLLAAWMPVVMTAIMCLSDSPRYEPTLTAYSIAAALVLYPALIGFVYYAKNWTFVILPPLPFLLLTALIPLGAAVFLFYSPIRMKLKGIRAHGVSVVGGSLYLDGQRIPEADPGSFADIGFGYSKDKNRVYFFREVLPGADPSRFRKLNDSKDDYTFRDDAHVYQGGRAVAGADPGTFRILKDGFARDRARVFHLGEPVEGVDAESFAYLDYGYGKDKNRVYAFFTPSGAQMFRVQELEGADPATFTTLPEAAGGFSSAPNEAREKRPDAQDKNHRYRRGRILQP